MKESQDRNQHRTSPGLEDKVRRKKICKINGLFRRRRRSLQNRVNHASLEKTWKEGDMLQAFERRHLHVEGRRAKKLTTVPRRCLNESNAVDGDPEADEEEDVNVQPALSPPPPSSTSSPVRSRSPVLLRKEIPNPCRLVIRDVHENEKENEEFENRLVHVARLSPIQWRSDDRKLDGDAETNQDVAVQPALSPPPPSSTNTSTVRSRSPVLLRTEIPNPCGPISRDVHENEIQEFENRHVHVANARARLSPIQWRSDDGNLDGGAHTNEDVTVQPSLSPSPPSSIVSVERVDSPEGIRSLVANYGNLQIDETTPNQPLSTVLKQWKGTSTQGTSQDDGDIDMDPRQIRDSNRWGCCDQARVYTPLINCFNCRVTIQKDDSYYDAPDSVPEQDRMILCDSCFKLRKFPDIPSPTTADKTNNKKLRKADFVQRTHDQELCEPELNCFECDKTFHTKCENYFELPTSIEDNHPRRFICSLCTLKETGINLKLGVENLSRTKLSNFIESRLDDALTKTPYPMENKVFVRVVSSTREVLTLDSELQRLLEKFRIDNHFPYTAKVIFCFQRSDNGDCMMFFGLYVQEYDDKCPAPNRNSIYISMLDSVRLFQPAPLRKFVHQMVLSSYIEYMTFRGFETAFFWSCPPRLGDEYVFHHRPVSKEGVPKSASARVTEKKKNLNLWYQSLMRLCKALGFISDFGSLYDWCTENMQDFFMKFPYFQDDHWPDAIKEIIVDCNKKKPTKKSPRKNSKSKNRKGKICSSEPESLEESVFKKMQTELKKYRDSFYRMSLTPQGGAQHQDEVDFILPSNLAFSRDKLAEFFKEYNLEFRDNRNAIYSTTAFITKTCADRAVCHCSSCELEIEKGFFCRICNLSYCVHCCTSKCKREHDLNTNFIDIINPVVK